MQNEILYRPSYSLLRLIMQPNEQVLAEAGAMVSMTPNVTVETQARGGLLGGLKRSFLGGESFFINTFTCTASAGELTLAPSLPGDLMHVPMAGGVMLVHSGSYIASSTSVNQDTQWGGAKGFFSGAGFFLLRCEGHGDLFVSSYGAIHMVELQAGQGYIVDTGHIVAFEGTMSYNVKRVGGWKATLLSGEGLICEFVGPGRLYLQTRSFEAFLGAIIPRLPKSSS
jgi:uncharacterized protein (TIGR00266 family)